ncbi:unnamed protein product [Clonostachys chloroleuca]|uniref:Uncharacterized protein n=1 Tax=Clonostachys chloroleuca TaxID=1926264 RepID=A0AA35M153_9HYPO|nr:unnamed protein product [Clonostachys chloroleuca]
MGTDTLDTELPPSYEAATGQAPYELVEPASLVLHGMDIVVENKGDATPLYQLSRNITALPPKNNSSSIHLHRVERGASEKTNGEPVTTHIFHLVHPVNADFRDDLPPYYVTATSPDALGNIILEANKHTLQRTEFSAKLSRDTNSGTKPLFHAKDDQQLVFYSKNSRKGGQEWLDQHGKLLATECHNDQLPTLKMETPVPRKLKDALVAMWCTMLWYELAESRGAKRERKCDPTPYVAEFSG